MVIYLVIAILYMDSLLRKTPQHLEYTSAEYLLYGFAHFFILIQLHLLGKTGVSYNFHSDVDGFNPIILISLVVLTLGEMLFGIFLVFRSHRLYSGMNDNWFAF